MGYVIVAVVAVVVAIFAMQNTMSVDVAFLAWQIAQVPVAAVVLASLGAGLVIAGIPLWFQLWRTRRRARALEEDLAASRAVREARLASPHPAPAPRPPAEAPSPPRPPIE